MHATEDQPHFDFTGLSVPQRLTLAQRLWESVREELTASPLTGEQEMEIGRRMEAIDRGFLTCEPFDAMMNRLAGR